MFKQGPVPAFVHGVIEYLAAALFIAAPFVFSFEDDTATAVSPVDRWTGGPLSAGLRSAPAGVRSAGTPSAPTRSPGRLPSTGARCNLYRQVCVHQR